MNTLEDELIDNCTTFNSHHGIPLVDPEDAMHADAAASPPKGPAAAHR